MYIHVQYCEFQEFLESGSFEARIPIGNSLNSRHRNSELGIPSHYYRVQPLRHNLAVLHTCKIVGLASADLQLRFTLAKQLSTYDFQNELQTLWLRVLWVQP